MAFLSEPRGLFLRGDPHHSGIGRRKKTGQIKMPLLFEVVIFGGGKEEIGGLAQKTENFNRGGTFFRHFAGKSLHGELAFFQAAAR